MLGGDNHDRDNHEIRRQYGSGDHTRLRNRHRLGSGRIVHPRYGRVGFGLHWPPAWEVGVLGNKAIAGP